MSVFVGIDLGTTNSALCTFDGVNTRMWKSPEQNEVTPSAIFIDRRGKRYVGQRAYDAAPHSPNNSAVLFKRLMGSSTPIELSAVDLSLTPEECSAEILRVLYGYLSEEIRNDPETCSVITVPAAFNQMQKDATMSAASMAGIGRVALMQEPVAAVMSVVKGNNKDGVFLVYDLGGGTLDVSVSQCIDGRISLLATDGIAMCGGRDFDRTLFDLLVRPWLMQNFDLSIDSFGEPKFNTLVRLATWAAEKSKIELSSRNESVISLTEVESRTRDLSGKEIYLEIPLKRGEFDELISERVAATVNATKEVFERAGLSSDDIDRIVFVGGPTNYKPLRDRIATDLGIPFTSEVDPMTAVAEGASLFAESIDWDSHNRSRKVNRQQLSTDSNISIKFNYMSRTPKSKAMIVAQLLDKINGYLEFQIDCLDTGWTSGRIPLTDGAQQSLDLSKAGDNTFKIFVFDSSGSPVTLDQSRIVIKRTAATVDAIPASHSIGIEVLEKLGGRPVLDWIIRAGDPLPQKARKVFKAAETLKSGTSNSLNFKLWEGEIEDSISDNVLIGVLKISGSDFDDGVIPAGADLECEYEILDSGNIVIEVSVPCIGGTFHSGRNFYSRQEGQIDYTSSSLLVIEQGQKTMDRVQELSEAVEDPRIGDVKNSLSMALSLNPSESEPERTQEALAGVRQARRLLAEVRKKHLKATRKVDLEKVVAFFEEHVRQHARESESESFDNLAKTAQRSIDRNDRDFEHHLDDLRGKNYDILWRQDWFVIDRFNTKRDSPHLFADRLRYDQLIQLGEQYVRTDEIEKLRRIVDELWSIQIDSSGENEMFETANIIRK